MSILKLQPRFLNGEFEVVLVCSPGANVLDIGENEGVAVNVVKMRRGISPFRDIVSIVGMVRCILRCKPEIVHSYTPKAGLIAMIAARLCFVPVRVHTFTGLIFPTAHGIKRELLIWIDRLICFCATRVIPEGNGVKNDLQRFRITHRPLQVIGHGNIAGVDTSYFSPNAIGLSKFAVELKTQLGIDSDAFVFCFVGRLNKDKGIGELMQAFAALPSNAHLLFVGELDQTAPVGADVLASIEAHPRVHMLGFLVDVRPALRVAHVLVLPSYREGFPNVVLQAGAVALPVIATDINGCNEVIEPGFNGWLVPPRDAPALQCAMRDAMQTSATKLQEMGSRGRERVQIRFEQRGHWERMAQLYRGMLPAD
ncbi:glycosyltransferase family 4 protein [Cupriavidus basilensis]|uniref:glycosyltransferase family 4 protein n=1 Tax=Cupriavidus basilensis TaxID=68895 RepID=UPI003D33D1F7